MPDVWSEGLDSAEFVRDEDEKRLRNGHLEAILYLETEIQEESCPGTCPFSYHKDVECVALFQIKHSVYLEAVETSGMELRQLHFGRIRIQGIATRQNQGRNNRRRMLFFLCCGSTQNFLMLTRDLKAKGSQVQMDVLCIQIFSSDCMPIPSVSCLSLLLLIPRIIIISCRIPFSIALFSYRILDRGNFCLYVNRHFLPLCPFIKHLISVIA